MHRRHGTGNRRLHFGFHFHRFADQYRLTGLDRVTDLDQYIDDIAWHAGADIARRPGLLTLARTARDKIIQRFKHHFFRHAVDRQVEVALAVALHANAGDVDAVAFAVYIHHEFGRYTFTTRWGHTAGFRDRQQHFRRQGAGSTVFKELAPDIREHGIGQHVFFGLSQAADFLTQFGHLRLDQVGRTHFDDFFAANRLLAQLFVALARRQAVATLQVELHLVGDGFITLTGEDVEHRLGADNLRGRRHRGREAEVFTHPRDFREHLVDAVQRALLFQLVGQVGHHPARHLVDLHAGVHGGELALELVVLLAHGVEVQADLLNQRQIQPGVVGAALERGDHRLGTRMAGAPGEAGDGGVDMVSTGFNRLVLAHP